MNGDQISRQAAIDEIRTMQTYKLFAGDDMLLVDQANAMTNLMMMPTAEPTEEQVKEYCIRRNLALIAGEVIETMRRLFLPAEPRTGEWLDDCGDMACSCCGFSCDDPYYLGEANYCPNCGARMTEENDEADKREE